LQRRKAVAPTAGNADPSFSPQSGIRNAGPFWQRDPLKSEREAYNRL
jgi:hypothetical protein